MFGVGWPLTPPTMTSKSKFSQFICWFPLGAYGSPVPVMLKAKMYKLFVKSGGADVVNLTCIMPDGIPFMPVVRSGVT